MTKDVIPPNLKEDSMKSLIVFACKLLEELGSLCLVSTERDIKTVTSRFEDEGLSFLTITLPSFSKSLEKAIDLGRVEHSHFDPTWGFRGGVPKFLSGFLALIFDPTSGVLLAQPSITAIRAIRQFSLLLGKLEIPCSEERTRAAFDKYVECESEIRRTDQNLSSSSKREFEVMALRLWGETLSDIDRKIYAGEIKPKHGPGATADQLIGNQKYDQVMWTTRLEREFNFLEFACASWSQNTELHHVDFREPGDELPVKVISVPKTLKTPRLIAKEPTCMQYMQQAIFEAISETFREFDHPWNFICSDSQIPNQELARKGSRDGSLATLDLSEASDRVSNQHVRMLLAHHPSFFDGVDACRSRKADVQGEVIRLAKFASMGSALTFPMEALVFSTIVFLGIQRSLGHRLSDRDIKLLYGRVRVYGDDIIVPTEHVHSVKFALEEFGLKVNADKSFWTGKFRESCGGDYYDGYDVSICRVRKVFPTNRSDAEELASTVELRNHLARAGFEDVVKWLDDLIEAIIPFPTVLDSSPILGKWHPQGYFDSERMHPELQIPLVKGVRLRTKLPVNSLNGYGALLKWYLKRGEDPFEDIDHLKRSGRPIIVSTKYGWARSY